MSKVQRIVVVSEIFHPEESATAHIITKIAIELVREFELLVLTGPVFYDGKVHHGAAQMPVDGISISRIWTPNLSKNKILERSVRLLMLTIALSWKTLLKSRRTDIVFAVTNPAPFIVFLALVRKLRRFRLVFLVHDLFPENAIAAGIIRQDNFLYPTLKRIFEWAYSSADAVITIGRDMSEVITLNIPSIADKITLIENWADHPLIQRIPRNHSMIPGMGFSNRIVIQYAGNIGRTQGLLEFVELVSATQNDNVRFVFRGSGALSSALYEATKGQEKFRIEGAYTRYEQSQVLGSCDIALVILGPNMYGLGVPSKAYNIMAAGKAILFIGPKDSEIYRIVKVNNIGWAFDWHEASQLIDLINNLSINDIHAIEEFGENARKLVEMFYTEATQLAKYRTFFHKLHKAT